MNANELRERYLHFFEARGHRRIPSAPLVPENDPTVLFTTAGMHPLVPFLLGEPHPLGRRLVNFQKCIRTNDIEEVGDPAHLTFFEMLGNWSLGDYFKEDSLAWSYEFLTQELHISPDRLAVTVFTGDETAPRDDTSAGIWQRLGLPVERIFYLPKADNWWGPAGATGPCGPDSEIFYDTGRPDHPGCRPGCPCGKWLEIWNNVFMEYEKRVDGSYVRLAHSNVDTGMGVERTVVALRGEDDVFKIETLYPLIQALERLSGRQYSDQPAPFRVIADHLRAATFAIADGVLPGKTEANYVVRRLIRRAIRHGHDLGIHQNFCADLSGVVVDLFCAIYPNLAEQREKIAEVLALEENNFKETLERGLKKARRISEAVLEASRENGTPAQISGADAFNLYETDGFPLELTVELAREQGLSVDTAGFEKAYEQHREDSKKAAEEGRFTSGLADNSLETTRLHTASHLLQAALRRVLGPEVKQRGSNITPQRLRFDFSHNERLSEAQLAEVERLVNEQIARDLPVTMETMPLQQALASGALAFFSERYSEQVKVYTIGDFSREVCNGPHVSHTGELGHFKILKQEAVGQGIRRIRATVEG